MGTGNLYVLDEAEATGPRLSAGKLRKERRALNVTETEESFVAQYLVLGGHRWYVTLGKEEGAPWLVASGVHAGAGRQVFGWSEQQRCDLLLAFVSENSRSDLPSRLYFHNHHGNPWHYSGHRQGCPQKQRGELDRYLEKTHSALADDFRGGLAEVLSSVAPHRALFFYTTTSSCQLSHGMPVRGLDPPEGVRTTGVFRTFGSAKECLLLSESDRVREARWIPSSRQFWDRRELTEHIRTGRATGFVVVRGGRESEATRLDDPAGHRFGFCVQKYAPTSQQLGPFTLSQIAGYYGWTEADDRDQRLEEFVKRQQSRTLCASSFLSEETVSTTYLAWLMSARGFADFEITHFLEYKFCDWAGDFLGPVLQRRHERKRAGDLVAAECLKLIGNGSYGYNGLEASNYDDLRILTDKSLQQRYRGDMAHRKLKHVTFLGVVKTTEPARKRRKKKKASGGQRRRQEAARFLDREADVEEDDDDEEEDQDDEADDAPPRSPRAPEPAREEDDDDLQGPTPGVHPEYSSDSDQGNLSDQESWEYSYARHKALLRSDNGPARSASLAEEEEDDGPAAAVQDLEESLVRRAEEEESGDLRTGRGGRPGSRKVVYRLLYAVSVSGEDRSVVNSLPRAVAVLSNSKRLFLSHLDCMFRCLDSRKAELCYVDTDSCIWSLSERRLEQCLRPDRLADWEKASIVADEAGPLSCHGLMKLEGTYRAGLFKCIKMYRLFGEVKADDERLALSAEENPPVWPENDSRLPECVDPPAPPSQPQQQQSYTRCKGIHRQTAQLLRDRYFFQTLDPERVVVHRTSLRPSRAGEIFLTKESKSLAVPFNLKRRVDDSGLHSDCFVPSPVSEDPDETDDA